MSWLILFIAGLFETVWAVAMKYSEGLTRLRPTLLMVVAMAISLWLLAYALRTLPLGTAYAVWTGIGALGTVIYGMVFLGETVSLLRMLFIAMILGGIIGLKVVSSRESGAEKTEQSQPVGTESEAGDHPSGSR